MNWTLRKPTEPGRYLRRWHKINETPVTVQIIKRRRFMVIPAGLWLILPDGTECQVSRQSNRIEWFGPLED
jgi:hypothetical protein